MTMYEAETQVTRAKLSIFRQMGTLLSALQMPTPQTATQPE